MSKVLKDGTLGISEEDRFIEPAGMHLNLSCSGGDEDATSGQKAEEEYFFD
jgi:penicillin-binding protein 1A